MKKLENSPGKRHIQVCDIEKGRVLKMRMSVF